MFSKEYNNNSLLHNGTIIILSYGADIQDVWLLRLIKLMLCLLYACSVYFMRHRMMLIDM